MMIWANLTVPPQQFGKPVATVWLEGGKWDVWYARQGSNPEWNTVLYVREQPANAITVHIKDLTDDSITRGYVQPSWCMTSVQFGFEPRVGEPGLAVNSLSYGSAAVAASIGRARE
ncbi:hypothetical protein [Streptomyces sp. 769]|uniref:GH12 family glycosyl hydrolase domain-containing protein n=1 Tax=Streptomyces sp. 769 TaxID=1262452 RepID=UPI0023B0E9B5|nr:hypothetical protein [Streptomyces sp. 769]